MNLRAPNSLNGLEQPHVGPPLTPSAHSPGAPDKLQSGHSHLAWAMLQLCLAPASWRDPLDLGCSHVFSLIPCWLQTGLPAQTLDPIYHFALSGVVNGPCYEHLAMFRCCGTVPWLGWAPLCWDHPQRVVFQHHFYSLRKYSKICKGEVNAEVRNTTHSKETSNVK